MAFTKDKWAMTHVERQMLPVGGRVPEAVGGMCPRCSTRLTNDGEDSICLQCGFASYVDVNIGIGDRRARWTAPMGVMDRICYGGPNQSQYGLTFLQIEQVVHNPQIKFKPTCPYACGLYMRTLKKDRTRKSELNYICPDGHKVTIVTNRDFDRHWK